MRSQTRFNVAAVLVFGAIAMTALVLFNTRDRNSATKLNIEKTASTLRDADRRGDRGAAVAMLSKSVELLQKLNDETTATGTQPGCLLPMIHLSDGIVAVAKGARWESEDRYNSSFSKCQ